MISEELEQLRRQYTDRYVVVEADQPELARFQGAVGQVKTVNCRGRALVEFNVNNDHSWYDVPVSGLKIVEKPEPSPVVEKKPCPGKKVGDSAGPSTGETSADTPTA